MDDTTARNIQKIAEFMGWQRCEANEWFHKIFNNQIQTSAHLKSITLGYNTDWNSLMGACRQWDDLDEFEDGSDDRMQYEFLCDKLDHLIACYDIEPAFNQLVLCIDWYNKFLKAVPEKPV